jgi:predicted metal-dependent hydrolase
MFLGTGQRLHICLVPNERAKHYVLRLAGDEVRVTIPRGGTPDGARAFALRNRAWLERQVQHQKTGPSPEQQWRAGTDILFRGQYPKLEVSATGRTGCISFGSERVHVSDTAGDLRPAVEQHLRRLVTAELPMRVHLLAARHGFFVRNVTVRSQRSRWGSCSGQNSISLNWRLIHTPSYVCDYIIFHELAHLREMNHSARFWKVVERLCPQYRIAEHWLDQHHGLLQ